MVKILFRSQSFESQNPKAFSADEPSGQKRIGNPVFPRSFPERLLGRRRRRRGNPFILTFLDFFGKTHGRPQLIAQSSSETDQGAPSHRTVAEKGRKAL